VAAEIVVCEPATQVDTGVRAYRLAATESTLWANWFFNAANYSSYGIPRNTTTGPVMTAITWRDLAGAVVSSEMVTIPAGRVVSSRLHR
jgi:hypothetical protein